MSEIPGQSGHALPDLQPPVCANKRLMHRSNLTAYSITSSARASSEGGMVRPSVLAVWAIDVFVDALDLRDLGFDGVDPGGTPAPPTTPKVSPPSAPSLLRWY